MAVSMCEEGLFIDPRPHAGRKARRLHGARQYLDTPAAVYRPVSTAQIVRENKGKSARRRMSASSCPFRFSATKNWDVSCVRESDGAGKTLASASGLPRTR